MSELDHRKKKAAAKLTEVGGKVQKKTGQALGDRDMEAEGRGRQLKGKAKATAADVRKKAEDTIESIKKRAER
jgi:uncharacterized protein YjbJ (UPF0337 family)